MSCDFTKKVGGEQVCEKGCQLCHTAPTPKPTTKVMPTPAPPPQASCATIKLKGASFVALTAGTVYSDVGVVAHTGEGLPIPRARVFADGNTVNTESEYHEQGSCLQILETAKQKGVMSLPSGQYYITVQQSGSRGQQVLRKEKLLVYCDMETGEYVYT
jgi:hypothetical protein